jgi:hypothetical protein
MTLPGSYFFLMIQDPAAVITHVSQCGHSDLLTRQSLYRWPENADV